MAGFILRSILHYFRSSVVVMLAVAASTAVIGGALIVGDSVRASLQQMTLSRLGGISHVLHSPRFVREALADEISGAGIDSMSAPRTAPGLLLPGSVEKKSESGQLRRAASVSLIGLRAADWTMLDTSAVNAPENTGIVLGYRTASELEAAIGDSVSVWVELPSTIPRDSLLGDREETSIEIVLTVAGILPENAGASRFSLQSAQQLPYNAFLSLTTFQQRLNLDERVATQRSPLSRPARINTILAGNNFRPDPPSLRSAAALQQLISNDAADAESFTSELGKKLSTADIGLRMRMIEDRGYLSVESDSMIVEDVISDAVLEAANNIGVRAAPTLVYLANEINAASRTDNNSRYSMYSIIAGLDFSQPLPLGPFRLSDDREIPALNDNDIILCEWLAADLKVTVGDPVQVRWHEVGSHGDLPETHRTFTVRGILRAADPVSVDQNLTPFVEGVTNVDSFGDWKQPFEMEMDRITTRDDDYWTARRATPKAFVSLAVAEQFWKSRFGRYTSIRIASDGVALPADRLQSLQSLLTSELQPLIDPVRLGLRFRPIRAEGLQAASGASDFSVLFLGFSSFLIMSAILLAALMFQLSIRQRVAQIGLMEALGFTSQRARWFFVSEGVFVALCGAIPGSIIAVYAAKLMIYGLTTWWIGAIGTQFLQLDVQPQKPAIAAVISLALSALVIWNAVRRTSQRAPRELLSGLASDDLEIRRPFVQSLMTAMFAVSVIAAFVLPAAGIARLLPSSEAFQGLSWRVVGFFLGGFAWLFMTLLLLRRNLRKRAGDAVTGSQIASLTSLALVNASRNPARSLLTAALIASATFVIVAVGAGRRNPVSEIPEIQSGNGGFSLVAESSVPILFDMNTPDGRTRLGLNTSETTSLPEGSRVFGFRVKPGEDASCLNLYQATVPTLLGATPEFIDRGGFRFAETTGDNPWTLLSQSLDDLRADKASGAIPAIPVLGDLNTLQYNLKKGIGDVILFPDSNSPEFALQIVGMLDGSVFQGVLVMSDVNLLRIAPDVSGDRYFLIETPDLAASDRAASALETALQPYGMDTERVSRRLADFLAVQNTYLATFRMLGGLGLLVGTFGLATVMLRNVVERRAEIALLRSLGFPDSRMVWLILSENTLLLLWGIAAGAVSAFIAMLPHLLSTGADVPWIELGATLAAVAIIGTLAVILPIRTATRVTIRDVLSAE